jgi:hypothetical protein
VLAIVIILGGSLNDTTAKILATTLTISLTSLLSLAAFSGWEARGAAAYSRVGLAASFGATVMLVYAIWGEPYAKGYWQLTVSFLLIAVACGQGSLLALAKLAPVHRWVRSAANTTGILLCAALLAVVWEAAGNGDTIWRAIAVLSVLDVALMMATLVCHVLGRVAPPGGTVAEVLFCLRCGKQLWVPAGEVRCHHCEKRYFVELRPDGDLPDAVVRDPS